MTVPAVSILERELQLKENNLCHWPWSQRRRSCRSCRRCCICPTFAARRCICPTFAGPELKRKSFFPVVFSTNSFLHVNMEDIERSSLDIEFELYAVSFECSVSRYSSVSSSASCMKRFPASTTPFRPRPEHSSNLLKMVEASSSLPGPLIKHLCRLHTHIMEQHQRGVHPPSDTPAASSNDPGYLQYAHSTCKKPTLIV